MKLLLTTLALIIGLAAPVFAQGNDAGSQQPGQAQQNASQSGSTQKSTQTTTTKTTTPTEVTRTTGVDPIWLVVGGIALLAIVLIAILSMRGRGRDKVVRESTTVIKE